MLKRAISLYIIFGVSLAVLMGRIVYLNNSEYSVASENNTVRTLTVGEKRATIYDRNYVKLTNSKSKLVAVVTPAAGAIPHIKKYMSEKELEEKIKAGFPFTLEVNERINNELIRTFEVPERYSYPQPAIHIIGYTDSDGKTGVSGLERAYNSFLNDNSGTLTVSFQADAKGRILPGMDKTINDDNYSSDAGIVLTVDSKIQNITQRALKNSKIESGCAIVMHVDTGEIFALASVPDYDPDNVALSLNKENSPFINKAFQSYCVGSVFKPLVVAAALENGKSVNTQYECTGEITVGDTVFSCYNRQSHGKVDMTGALEQSCNTYFINLIMNMDVELLLSLCESIGLGKSDEIYNGCFTSSGAIPKSEQLRIKGELANLAFGQGRLMMTPVQMLKMYHVLATGNYIPTKLIRGFTDYKGIITTQKEELPVKILSDSTVTALREMLSSVVEKGNADKACSRLVSLAGKTGTAQSGIHKNGKEICRTWFAGFFPSHNPHYIVVVMSEEGESGNIDCAPVFKEICEEICTVH